MLELDVQVETDVRPVNLVAPVVGAGEVLLDLDCQPPVFLAVLHLEELHVLLLQILRGGGVTSSLLTSACSWELFSDMSLMREKLS